MFDCLHDMGDPVGAVAHIRKTLKPDGTLMMVEPAAGDSLEDNLNPVGRVYYAGSTHDLRADIAQSGSRPGARRAGRREAARRSGARRRLLALPQAAETPFNMVLEARP